MLGEVISYNQSVFIGDRNILDGVVVANEIVNEPKKKKKNVFMFKIDFEKAYDSVSWRFRFDMIKLFGLERGGVDRLRSVSRWRRLLLINGSPSNLFRLGRDLRQGDIFVPFSLSCRGGGPK